MAKLTRGLVLKITLLVCEKLTFGKVFAFENAVPLADAGITRCAKLSALAWIPLVIAKPVAAGGGVIAASTFFALE